MKKYETQAGWTAKGNHNIICDECHKSNDLLVAFFGVETVIPNVVETDQQGDLLCAYCSDTVYECDCGDMGGKDDCGTSYGCEDCRGRRGLW